MAVRKFLQGHAPGVALCIALAEAGRWLAAALALPVPGAVIGLAAYLALLLTLGERLAWSRDGGRLLLRWLGALLVPALVGLGARAMLIADAALPLVLLLVTTTLVTAVATALLYRLAGGGDS
ncbi:hypothetical protein IP88_04635 [alpha proteobacterium AAP81b]|nr:hypothetical protein IP88_04635 [alpha proteobacterium AAP81b]